MTPTPGTVSSAPHLSGLVDRLVDFENTPPLYYLLVRPLPNVGEFWLRIPAVLASTAMIGVLYAWCGRCLARAPRC